MPSRAEILRPDPPPGVGLTAPHFLERSIAKLKHRHRIDEIKGRSSKIVQHFHRVLLVAREILRRRQQDQ